MTLREYYNAHKNNFPDNLRLRLHRAISWIEKSQDSGDDLDIKFISLWIAFNAAYAKDLSHSFGRQSDKSAFINFLGLICGLDKDKALYNIVWEKFPQSIRILLNNHYTFQPFWNYHNGTYTESAWIEDFDKAKLTAHRALAKKDTLEVLLVIFDRLYTLRNQIVHGGSTYDSSVNRAQVSDGCKILSDIVPAIINILMKYPRRDWGKPYYPLVKE